MAERQPRLYAVDAGDSGSGPIGFVARIWATTKEEALDIFDELYCAGEAIEIRTGDDRFDYFNVYIGTVTLDHVYDAECGRCGGLITDDEDFCMNCAAGEDD